MCSCLLGNSWALGNWPGKARGGKTAATAEAEAAAATHANWQKTKHGPQAGGCHSLPKILASPCWHGRGPVFAKDLAPFGPTRKGEPFFFWQSASSSSFLAGVVEFLVLVLAFHVCQTELWLVNIFVHSGRKKDSTGTTKQSNERNQKSSKQTMATNFVNLHKQLGVPIPLKGICNINFPCSQ